MCFPTNAEQYVHFRSFIFHQSGCFWIMSEKGGHARVVAEKLPEIDLLAEPRFSDTRNRCALVLFAASWLPRRLPGLAGGVRGSGH